MTLSPAFFISAMSRSRTHESESEVRVASKRKAATEAAPPAENGTGRNKPVHEVRLGRVKVAVWKNDTKEGGIRFAFTVSRSYKDQQGQWKSMSSFDPQNTS